MIEVNADKAGGLFTFVFSQKVTADEAKKWMTDIESRVPGMQAGFRLLADLSGLESMELQCAPLIARVMDLCNEAGVSKVIRVIPDPRKDIGLSILSLFHYDRDVRIVTFHDRREAEKSLE